MKETDYSVKICLALNLVLSDFNSNILFSAAEGGKCTRSYWIISEHGSYYYPLYTNIDVLAYEAAKTFFWDCNTLAAFVGRNPLRCLLFREI